MPARTQHIRKSVLLLVLLVAGCAVGPNFTPPPPPQSVATAPAAPAVSAAWWGLFSCATLDQTIAQALAQAPSITAQQAALRAAQQQYRATAGNLYPQLSGSLSATRSSSTGALENLGTAQISVSYMIDVWGGTRRAVEQQAAGVDQARYSLAASRLTLAGSIAQTMISIASLQDQIAATREILAEQTQGRDLIAQQFALGAKARADLLQQDVLIAQTNAALPPLAQQLDRAQHQLAALAGLEAGSAPPVHLSLADFTLPHDLPRALPAQLIEQRPDIQQQLAILHARTAALGVATANLLPSITLSASDETESAKINGLTQNGISLWNLGLGLTQPLFAGGTLRALRAEARAALDQQTATYQQVVLNALANVADSLTAIDHDRDQITADSAYETTAAASLALTRQQYQDGATDFASLLLQQQNYQQARLAQIQAQAAQYQDAITLFQALGGGWWGTEETAS